MFRHFVGLALKGLILEIFNYKCWMRPVILHVTFFFFLRNQVIYLKCKCWNFIDEQYLKAFNPLSTNPTKWSNTLKQFAGNSRRTIWVRLTILWGWCFGFDMPFEVNNI